MSWRHVGAEGGRQDLADRQAGTHREQGVMRHPLGVASAMVTLVLSLVYAVTLALGLMSLPAADQPIGQPWFSIMEVLIILVMPAMMALMTAIHVAASMSARPFTLLALVFMSLAAVLTTGVHFTILLLSISPDAALPVMASTMSFRWPSIAYAIDILAWDWFFALSVLAAASAFRRGRLETAIRVLLLVSGLWSLAGLIGPLSGNMGLRMIGVIGYAGVFPVAAALLARWFAGRPTDEAVRQR